jgi:hypothetical protein
MKNETTSVLYLRFIDKEIERKFVMILCPANEYLSSNSFDGRKPLM